MQRDSYTSGGLVRRSQPLPWNPQRSVAGDMIRAPASGTRVEVRASSKITVRHTTISTAGIIMPCSSISRAPPLACASGSMPLCVTYSLTRPSQAGRASLSRRARPFIFHADVIIDADGVKSTVQKAVTGLDDASMPTGDAAYRAIIPTDLTLQDAAPACRNPRDDCVDGPEAPSDHSDGLQHSECHLYFSIVLSPSQSER